MLKRVALVGAVLLIAGAVASMPANAEPKEGWFVLLEGINTQVVDASQTTGTVLTEGDPGGDPSIPDRFDHQFVDWDTDIGGRLGFGKQWGNGNKLTISYWTFDSDEDGSLDLATVDGFYSPFDYYYYYGYGGSAAARDRAVLGIGGPFVSFSRFDANVDATSIDLDFAHVHSITDQFDFEWSLGVKFADFEDTTRVESGYTYTDTYGVANDYFLHETAHNESDMWGFKAGVRGAYNFGERFSLTAGLGVGKLIGEVESTSAVGITTPTGTIHIFEDIASDDNRSGTITDYDIMGVIHIGEHFDVGIGYEHSTWQGIATDLMRAHWELPSRDDVGFTGWKLGLKFRFGGG
jgi:hypothetical protein